MDEIVVWRKASKSGSQGQCVEVACLDGGRVAVRDSKDPNGPILGYVFSNIFSFTPQGAGTASVVRSRSRK